MTGLWKARKSKSGFPALSTVPWKSRNCGAIPTFPPTTAAIYLCSPWRGGKPKTPGQKCQLCAGPYRLKVCREVPQERRLKCEPHALDSLAALPHREDHLDHVIYVALRVNATRDGQSHQVHRGCRSKHQRANLHGADAAFQIQLRR